MFIDNLTGASAIHVYPDDLPSRDSDPDYDGSGFGPNFGRVKIVSPKIDERRCMNEGETKDEADAVDDDWGIPNGFPCPFLLHICSGKQPATRLHYTIGKSPIETASKMADAAVVTPKQRLGNPDPDKFESEQDVQLTGPHSAVVVLSESESPTIAHRLKVALVGGYDKVVNVDKDENIKERRLAHRLNLLREKHFLVGRGEYCTQADLLVDKSSDLVKVVAAPVVDRGLIEMPVDQFTMSPSLTFVKQATWIGEILVSRKMARGFSFPYFFVLSNSFTSRLKHVPITPAMAPKMKYIVPISLWLPFSESSAGPLTYLWPKGFIAQKRRDAGSRRGKPNECQMQTPHLIRIILACSQKRKQTPLKLRVRYKKAISVHRPSHGAVRRRYRSYNSQQAVSRRKPKKLALPTQH
ncbi:hypothetical protein Tco_0688196 [Tanacetum coccineum]